MPKAPPWGMPTGPKMFTPTEHKSRFMRGFHIKMALCCIMAGWKCRQTQEFLFLPRVGLDLCEALTLRWLYAGFCRGGTSDKYQQRTSQHSCQMFVRPRPSWRSCRDVGWWTPRLWGPSSRLYLLCSVWGAILGEFQWIQEFLLLPQMGTYARPQL